MKRSQWEVKSKKKFTNATSVIMLNCVQPFWIDIWGRTVEKSQTNATDLTFHPLRLASWGYIWKHALVKSQTNEASVTLLPSFASVLCLWPQCAQYDSLWCIWSTPYSVCNMTAAPYNLAFLTFLPLHLLLPSAERSQLYSVHCLPTSLYTIEHVHFSHK